MILQVLESGPTWPRTRDLPVMSRWLFQLSYGPESPKLVAETSKRCQVKSRDIAIADHRSVAVN